MVYICVIRFYRSIKYRETQSETDSASMQSYVCVRELCVVVWSGSGCSIRLINLAGCISHFFLWAAYCNACGSIVIFFLLSQTIHIRPNR